MRHLIFVLLIINPLIVKVSYRIGLEFSVLNELISLYVFGAFAALTILKRKVTGMILAFVVYVLYMVLLAIYRDIIPLSLFQILIYCQFFFYFFYFRTLSQESQTRMMITFKKTMDIILIAIALIAIYEVADTTTFRRIVGANNLNRGINGFYLVSFFGSGPSLGIFTFLYVMIWHYYYYAIGRKISKNALAFLILAIVIAILSFSRKDVLFTFLFLIFFPYPARSKLSKLIKRAILAVGVFSVLLVYYLSFFESANRKGFDSSYVRWQIVAKSYEVFSDHAPFGSGAGTFGSRVSLMMPDLYEKYEVGQNMLGWKATNSRGPIYDAFLFTLTTEIGVGVLILIWFFYKVNKARPVFNNTYGSFIKGYLIFYILSLSFLVPMLTNSFGFLIMIFLACMTAPITVFKFRVSNK